MLGRLPATAKRDTLDVLKQRLPRSINPYDTSQVVDGVFRYLAEAGHISFERRSDTTAWRIPPVLERRKTPA